MEIETSDDVQVEEETDKVNEAVDDLTEEEEIELLKLISVEEDPLNDATEVAAALSLQELTLDADQEQIVTNYLLALSTPKKIIAAELDEEYHEYPPSSSSDEDDHEALLNTPEECS